MKQMMLQGTPIEDIVVVEDVSDDEESILDADLMIKDSVIADAVADGSTQFTVEAMADEPQLLDDMSMEATSSLSITVTKVDDLTCPPMHPSSLPTTPPMITTTRRRKSYGKSSLRRSARLAQHKLKDLGILANDGKLDEDAIQEYADCSKELLPPNLLDLLMHLKGRGSVFGCDFLRLIQQCSVRENKLHYG